MYWFHTILFFHKKPKAFCEKSGHSFHVFIQAVITYICCYLCTNTRCSKFLFSDCRLLHYGEKNKNKKTDAIEKCATNIFNCSFSFFSAQWKVLFAISVGLSLIIMNFELAKLGKTEPHSIPNQTSRTPDIFFQTQTLYYPLKLSKKAEYM